MQWNILTHSGPMRHHNNNMTLKMEYVTCHCAMDGIKACVWMTDYQNERSIEWDEHNTTWRFHGAQGTRDSACDNCNGCKDGTTLSKAWNKS